MFADVGGVPTVMQTGARDHDDNTFGGGIWIFALVIIFFALVFFRGFGNDRRDGGIAELAALRAVEGGTNGPAASAAFTELNGRFDALSQQVQHINDVNDLRDLKSTQAALNQNVTQQAFNLSSQIATNRTDTLLNFKDLTTTVMNGNCDIRRDIDAVKFQQAQDTCAILNNSNANAQRILDRMATDEITRLRDELARERLSKSQIRQDMFIEHQSDRVINRLTPPAPVPSYPSWPGCQPINPVAYGGYPGAPFVRQMFAEAV